MYNFRYHLITIVAIFAALALGLLLGVAITGSDLVRDASSNLAESLTEQFDGLRAENEELSAQLEVERLLETQLFDEWQNGRLEGRTIVVLTTADGTDFGGELAKLIEKSGGVPIVVAIDSGNVFAPKDEAEDEAKQAALRALLPEVEGEDYQVTLARALAKEWSGLAPEGIAHTRATFETGYPLTNHLVKSQRITVTVDYQPLLDRLDTMGAGPGTGAGTSADSTALLGNQGEAEGAETADVQGAAVSETQRTSLQFAQQLKLPYAANGLIDASLIDIGSGTYVYQVDELALQLALAFDGLGRADELPYLLEQRGTDGEPADEADGSADPEANYYALLVSVPEYAGSMGRASDTMRSASEESGLACVLNPLDRSGSYSIVALLSGADRGIYAFGMSGIRDFPPLPADEVGNAAFLQRSSTSP